MRDLKGMKHIHQSDNMACGTTSLAMVMKFLTSEKITIKEIDDDIRRCKKINTSPIDIVKYAQKKGLQARQYNHKTLEDIKDFAKEGIPMIAFIDPSPGDKMLHWVVLLGTEVIDDQEIIIINNPSKDEKVEPEDIPQREPWDDFKKKWARITVTLKALKLRVNFQLGYDNYFIGVGTKEDALDPQKFTDLLELLAGNTFEKGMTDVQNGWVHVRELKLGGLCQLLWGVVRFAVGTICLIPMNIFWLIKGDFKNN